MRRMRYLAGVMTGLLVLTLRSPAWPENDNARIRVTVDPRMELLAVVQLLAGYEDLGLINKADTPYRRDVEKHFGTYKDHAAVQQFSEMMREGFNFDAPPTTMLYFSVPPELKQQAPLTDYLIGRGGGEENLLRFIENLRDFAQLTNFSDFYNRHADWYRELVNDARAQTRGVDYITTLEAYFGEHQSSYHFILVPLFIGNFGPRIARGPGEYDIYSIMGPRPFEGGKLEFGSPRVFRYLAWHEFGHSFVNPVTQEHWNEMMKFSALYNLIAEQMKPQGYGSWQSCLNEHILRATTIRLTAKHIGTEEAESMLAREKERGFAYVEALVKELERYEADRTTYPTFASFYPELVKLFSRLPQGD